MNVPAKYREGIYWAVLISTVFVGVLSAFGAIPQDAVIQIVTVIGALLALKNITPDKPADE
jgi:hypothetical protein